MLTRLLVNGVKGWQPMRAESPLRLREGVLQLTSGDRPIVYQSGFWSKDGLDFAVVSIDGPVFLQFGDGTASSDPLGPFDGVRLVGDVICTGREQGLLARFDPAERAWRVLQTSHLWKEVLVSDAVPAGTVLADEPCRNSWNCKGSDEPSTERIS